ncbi:partial Oleate hydratase, partial [Methylococcales bacterium]
MPQTRQRNKTDVSAEPSHPRQRQAYFVGSGIASLAGAAFLIRDGHVPGESIHIFEELKITGGSLDGSGSADTGYVIRGGRMREEHYICTYGLLA